MAAAAVAAAVITQALLISVSEQLFSVVWNLVGWVRHHTPSVFGLVRLQSAPSQSEPILRIAILAYTVDGGHVARALVSHGAHDAIGDVEARGDCAVIAVFLTNRAHQQRTRQPFRKLNSLIRFLISYGAPLWSDGRVFGGWMAAAACDAGCQLDDDVYRVDDRKYSIYVIERNYGSQIFTVSTLESRPRRPASRPGRSRPIRAIANIIARPLDRRRRTDQNPHTGAP